MVSLARRLGALLLAVLLVPSAAMAQDRDAGGVVAAASPEAAEAGAEILRLGGNAVDAAVAVSLVLGVTEPAGSGIGGQTSMVLYAPGSRPVALNGTSFAPAATPVDSDRESLLGGHTATTIPATLRTLDYAWRNYGSGRVSWADLVAPAIRYAEQGYRLGPFRYRALSRSQAELRANPVTAALYLDEGGELFRPEALIRQPVLARTLRRIAEHGADDFYKGAIARQIAADMAANGGWITLADLTGVPPPQVLEPLRSTYRGHDLYTLPPPAGGWVVLRALNILENVPPETLRRPGPVRTLWLLDALAAAHRARRASAIGRLAGNEQRVAREIAKPAARADHERIERGGETTHFSIGDDAGMLVAVTQSLNSYYGARTASPALGFLYNDYMREFELGDRDHPFRLRPGGAPYSSMSATILAREGRPVMAVGSRGSARIISATAYVIHHWIDIAQDIEAAVAAPRVHVVPPARAYLEQAELEPALLEGLARRGYTLDRPALGLASGALDPYFGGVHAVALEDGRLEGAADPRRDGAVIRENRAR